MYSGHSGRVGQGFDRNYCIFFVDCVISLRECSCHLTPDQATCLLREGLMFLKCANSECEATFDNYRQGRLFRFHRSHPKRRAPANTHYVQHFWLRNGCSETYSLEYCRGRVKLTIRDLWIFSDERRESSDGGGRDSSQTPLPFGMVRSEDTAN
jgi:hypothetical protein